MRNHIAVHTTRILQYEIKISRCRNFSATSIRSYVPQRVHTVTSIRTFSHKTTIGDIAEYNYSIIHRASRQFNEFKFDKLQKYFPNLRSLREFITDAAYLRDIRIIIESRDETPVPETLFEACKIVLKKIGEEISTIREVYEGTVDFDTARFSEVFRDKIVQITDPHGEGEGVSQNAHVIRPEWKIDLSAEDWFVFNDNYGTTEEKSFVAYFARYVKQLEEDYEKVYLVRNNRQLALYSFDGGERFEPDYLIFLRKKNSTGYEQYQIFVEPKGDHLLTGDKWKEDFLIQIESKGIPKRIFADDTKYYIWGLPFYNMNNKMTEFTDSFERILPSN